MNRPKNLISLAVVFLLPFLLLLLAPIPSRAQGDSGTAVVTLAWNAVPDLDIDHYELSYGTASKTYTATVSTTAIQTPLTLPVGIMQYASVVAVNTSGLKSPPSNELIFQVFAPGNGVPPQTPGGLHRTNIAVTLQSSPDLKIWSNEYVSTFSYAAAAHFWRLKIDTADTN